MSRKHKKNNNSKPNSLIDVVIVTGGRFDMLAKCLDALYREAENVPLNIVVVDNNSPAEEFHAHHDLYVRREGSKVVKFSNTLLSEGLGYAEANNLGARKGNAPYIMFLNDDVELQPGAIQTVLDTFVDDTVGIVGIKLLFPLDSTSPIRPAGKVQHVGMALNIRGEPIHPLVGWSADHPKANVSRDCISVTGACLTIRRSLFNQVGGFSLEYGLGTFEDVDLCMKALRWGKRVYVNVKALGYHYTGSTAEKKRIQFPMAQNRMIFQTKWGSSGIMQWTEWEFL